MELHKFDILQCGTCACRNRHAVTAAVVRADGVLPDTACTAGRKDGCLCVKVFDKARLLVDNLCAYAALCLAFTLANQVQ